MSDNTKWIILGGAVIVSIVATAIITARAKDKAYETLIEQHDEATAKRLSEQFNNELEKLKEDLRRERANTAEIKARINALFKKYGMKPMYA